MNRASASRPAAHPALHYVYAWLALIILTIASYTISRFALGTLETAVAFVIAAIKAFIVLLVFMHLSEAGTSARVVASVAVAFILLLCLGIYADVGYR